MKVIDRWAYDTVTRNDWKLHVADASGMDKGKLNKWEIEIKG